MRNNLLKSFIFVVSFWWLATTFWWSVADPATNLHALQRLAALMPFAHFSMPTGPVTVLDALGIQKQVLTFWSVPILLIVALVVMAAKGAVWYFAVQEKKERDDRVAPSAPYRGLTVTKGVLPRPPALPSEELDFSEEGAGVFEALQPGERQLLLDILGVLAAHPTAYAGEGHAVPLLTMALNAVEKAISHKTRPGLAAIVAAASELGKLTAYRKEGTGRWVATKSVPRESATHLAKFDSWWALPHEDRVAVSFAVRFHGDPEALVDTGEANSVLRLTKSLLYKAAAATEKASSEEHARVLTQRELSELAFDTFVGNLSTFGFQDGLPKGVPAIGWKVGARIYLLEIKLRETLLAKLPDDVRGALTAKEKRGLHPLTVELMKGLHKHGWLVREINGQKLTARDSIWNIQAGKYPFKGVLVLDVPTEHIERLPTKDSIYAVTVTGALFGGAPKAALPQPAAAVGETRPPADAKSPPEARPTDVKPAERRPEHRSSEAKAPQDPLAGGFTKEDLMGGILRKPTRPVADHNAPSEEKEPPAESV